MKLSLKTFKTIIEFTPLISMDLVVQNKKGEILLGKRNNRPAQGYWFVPGGRILKGEPMSIAFKRLTLNELGAEYSLAQAEFIGPFEHFYSDNVTGHEFSTHYVALGYRILVGDAVLSLPTEQHHEYKWLPVDELLKHPNVHKYTRCYFES